MYIIKIATTIEYIDTSKSIASVHLHHVQRATYRNSMAPETRSLLRNIKETVVITIVSECTNNYNKITTTKCMVTYFILNRFDDKCTSK